VLGGRLALPFGLRHAGLSGAGLLSGSLRFLYFIYSYLFCAVSFSGFCLWLFSPFPLLPAGFSAFRGFRLAYRRFLFYFLGSFVRRFRGFGFFCPLSFSVYFSLSCGFGRFCFSSPRVPVPLGGLSCFVAIFPLIKRSIKLKKGARDLGFLGYEPKRSVLK
jgi:hypothetical protein